MSHSLLLGNMLQRNPQTVLILQYYSVHCIQAALIGHDGSLNSDWPEGMTDEFTLS